jgi:UDP-N-acetylglucosamine 2-epimerase (non-hydrolysing)
MKKLKVMTVVGTRPEIIRLSELIKKLDRLDFIDHVLVHTGQNYDYELNQIFFEDLNLRKPNYYLNAAMDSPAATIGKTLIEIDKVLETEKPDKFLILGDTNSALSAIAAKKRRIPIYHMEAGNRCFDDRVPEETNRKLVDHISDYNLPYSYIAREYLIQEGIQKHRIIKTGSPMFEVLSANKASIEQSKILSTHHLEKNNYIVISSHREENVSNSSSIQSVFETINKLYANYKLPIIVSLHPRTKKELEQRNLIFDEGIVSLAPMAFSDYIHLQMNAKYVVSDSGTISEEAAILGIKAVNFRTSQERPEAFELGIVPLSGLRFEDVIRALTILDQRNTPHQIPEDYRVENFSERVINTIVSSIK